MKTESVITLPEQLNRKGSAMLAVGIVKQAVKDYKDAVKMHEKVPDHFESRCKKVECEIFFCSEWFQKLREFAPDVIPADVMRRLEK